MTPREYEFYPRVLIEPVSKLIIFLIYQSHCFNDHVYLKRCSSRHIISVECLETRHLLEGGGGERE